MLTGTRAPAAPTALPQTLRDVDLAVYGRDLARGVPPIQLIARLLASTNQAFGAMHGGVWDEHSKRWHLPLGASTAMTARLDHAVSSPSASEFVVAIPLADGERSIGKLVLVVSSVRRLDASGADRIDRAQLVDVLTTLLVAIQAAGETRGATDPVDARERSLVNDIRRDLGAGLFVPHFQPIVALATGDVAAFDSLVRWNHPDRGWINAAEFFPQAKRAGLIADLESIVFRRAAERARKWLDRGVRRVRVNVKVSGERFETPELLDELTGLVRSFRLPSGTLGLSVTESTLTRATSNASLPAMRAAGFRVTLEHFGTGYASATALRPFPLYALKIDQSIVKNVDHDPTAERAARAVVQVAHALDLRAIAEGVEREDQRQALVAMKCDAGQGFLWSAAVEAEVADSMMRFQPFAARLKQR